MSLVNATTTGKLLTLVATNQLEISCLVTHSQQPSQALIPGSSIAEKREESTNVLEFHSILLYLDLRQYLRCGH